MNIGIILLILVVLLLCGGLVGPQWGAPWTVGYGYGTPGVSVLGVVLVVVLVLLVMGRL